MPEFLFELSYGRAFDVPMKNKRIVLWIIEKERNQFQEIYSMTSIRTLGGQWDNKDFSLGFVIITTTDDC